MIPQPTEPDYDVEPVISSAALQRQQQIFSSSSSPINCPKRLYFFSSVYRLEQIQGVKFFFAFEKIVQK